MNPIIQNADPKRNPWTSSVGLVFLTISAVMYVMKYIMPAFIEFKQELPYEWYTPLFPLGIGILLIFINDTYFAKIFNRVDKVAAKKTDTEQP